MKQHRVSVFILLAGIVIIIGILGYRNQPAASSEPPLESSSVSEIEKVPFLFQFDSQWSDERYGDGTMAENGCGPTCLAMVAQYLTGNEELTPLYIAQYADRSGYYVNGAGSSWDLMREGCEAFGIRSEELPLSESAMTDALDNGHPIILAVRPGDFTTVGHFIVLSGYCEDGFSVHDPNSRERSEKLWSYETLSTQISNIWAFSLK